MAHANTDTPIAVMMDRVRDEARRIERHTKTNIVTRLALRLFIAVC